MGYGSGYESTRAELLTILADLVVPATLVREAEEQPQPSQPETPQPPLPTTQPGDQAEETPSKLRNLVLARVKLIDERLPQIIEILETNQDTTTEGVTLPETSPRGTLLRDVINHLRTLPTGYKASPQARERAWDEERIVLPPEGVTYVKRQSKDPEADDSPGHKAQFRRPSDARRRPQKPNRKKNKF